jgi:serine/threonine-protein kinase haspin
MVKNPKTQPDDGRRNPRSQTEQLSQSRNPNRYLKVDDDTISLISTNTTSSLRSSRSRFRLSSIFSSSYKKENDAESIRSLKGKSSFNDIRRSVLRLNKKESISDLNRNMISLPIPDNDSRLKLSNRLRNSSSIISINSVMSRQPTIATMNTTLNTTTSTMNDYNNVQLEKLIKLTGKDQFYTFSDYINKVLNLTSNEVLIKFNEASYSEVFQVKNFKTGKIEKILKIIPFGDDSIDQPSVDNVLQELTINLRICNYPGFIKINDSMVVEGSYPNFLLKLWDDFNELKGSKNSRPDEFNTNQKYLILDLEYGGLDLERFKLNKSGEGLEIFWQIVQILSTAEKNLNFEHRDLHWGNIVIDRIEDEMDEIDADLSNISIDEDSTTKFTKSKLSVKLIDYTLSRLNEGDTVIFTGLDHPDFFKGKGDYQFDIYRFMRNEIQSRCEKQIDWSIFTPRTNLYWLHYVLLKIINGKSIKKRSKDHSFRKLEYLAKCLDPRRKRVNSDVSSRPNFKNGGSKWLNYYSTDFRNCSDVLKLGEVCKLF